MEITEINLVKKSEISKADIQEMCSQLIEKIDNGDINPLLLLQHLKAIEKVSEGIKSKLTDACVRETSKYKEKEILLFGAAFKQTEAGVSYDFSGCNDPVYETLSLELEDVKKRVKERENFLKGIKDRETVVNEGTGEIITVFCPVKKSSTIVQCSIK